MVTLSPHRTDPGPRIRPQGGLLRRLLQTAGLVLLTAVGGTDLLRWRDVGH